MIIYAMWWFSPSRVCEFGMRAPATALLPEALRKQGAIVFVTDLPSNIAIARKHINPFKRITYKACDINKNPFVLGRPFKQFDKIVCSMVLMDWEGGWKERDKLYKRFNSALKPGGELIITIKHPIRTRFEAEGITDVYENSQGGLVVKTNRPGTYLLEPATKEHGGKFWALKNLDDSSTPAMIKYEKTTLNGFKTHHVHRPSHFYTSLVGDCGFELKEVYGPLTPKEGQRSPLDQYLPVIQTMIFTKKENSGTYTFNMDVPSHLDYFSPMGDDVYVLKPEDPRLQKPESVTN
ncbi:MAG: methyltransferase domain-containing protein [Vampirovibrionales bacterium]